LKPTLPAKILTENNEQGILRQEIRVTELAGLASFILT